MLVLSGCGGAVEKDINDNGEASPEIEKGLFDVTITMPGSMVETGDFETTIEEARKGGINSVVLNDDGSITYKMSRAVHKTIMQEMRESFNEMIDDLKTDSESIKDVKYNKKLSAVTLTVEREIFENSFDGFSIFGLGIGAMYYQLFDGVKADDIAVSIDIVDASTGEVFNTVVYPDDLESLD